MSAGHCFYDDVSKMSLRAGSTVRESGGVVSGISTVIYHENYDSTTLDNDIVVVQLPTDGYEAPAGLRVTAVGWGMLSTEVYHEPEQLQKVDLYVDENWICGEILADVLPVTDSMMCAGDINKGVCFGDSGGPLLYGDVQVGITSWGQESCEYPLSAFTDIGFLRSWIRNATGV
ncbi:trypsin Blo t 3-like [Schistocerca nitens]|uniref:trypsin Blo t 3-like n=1 Tax=Schistocerca nitens TaxID=7011 RepID=UPI0021177F16|nr:trypsin Blo t 3-like [Schistocerca nitens]